MEQINFVDRIEEIINNDGGMTTKIPNIFKVVFDKIIQDRKKDYYVPEPNDLSGFMTIGEDELRQKYISYTSESGHTLLILKDTLDYGFLEEGIPITTSYLFNEIKSYYDEIRTALKSKITQKQKDKIKKARNSVERAATRIKEGIDDDSVLKRGKNKIIKGIETIDSANKILDETGISFEESDLSGEQIAQKILEYYEFSMKKQEIYAIDGVDVDKELRDGVFGPRPGDGPVLPKEIKPEFELENRLEGIKKLVKNKEQIIINQGEFYAFSYDLSNNENDEKGTIIIIEPAKREESATRILYLPEEELEKRKNNAKTSNPELEAKAEFVKEMLEDIEQLNKRGTRQLHRNYGQWLAIMDYYLRGSKELNPEILKMIEKEQFKQFFPRKYIKDSRKEMIGDTGER